MFQSLDKSLPAMSSKLTSDTSERIRLVCLTLAEFDRQDGELSFVDKRKRDLVNFYTQLLNQIEQK